MSPPLLPPSPRHARRDYQPTATAATATATPTAASSSAASGAIELYSYLFIGNVYVFIDEDIALRPPQEALRPM